MSTRLHWCQHRALSQLQPTVTQLVDSTAKTWPLFQSFVVGWQFPHCLWDRAEDHGHEPGLLPDILWPELSGPLHWSCRVPALYPFSKYRSQVQQDTAMLSLFPTPGWSFHGAVHKASLSSILSELSYEPAHWAGLPMGYTPHVL